MLNDKGTFLHSHRAESAKVFYKGAESKYSRFCGPYSVFQALLEYSVFSTAVIMQEQPEDTSIHSMALFQESFIYKKTGIGLGPKVIVC